MANKKVLAVITARGGSKRVPRKNLRKIGDQTLLERTVQAALNAETVGRCILSSDCSEIIEEALDYGCDVPFVRPSELATDSAKSEDVLEHALDNLPGFDWVLLLQPTSPFRTSGDIDSAFKLVQKINRNSCVGVTRVQSLIAGTVQHPFDGDVFNAAAQKQQRLNASARLSFALNGAIYLIKTSQFQSTKRLVDSATVGIEMSAKTGLDIDTFEDLKSAAELMGV